MEASWIAALVFLAVGIVLARTSLIVVPAEKAYVVERMGRFRAVLGAGLHVLVPFVDVVRFEHSLAEDTIEVASVPAVSRDNVEMAAGGKLRSKVVDAEKASYGVADLRFALNQLAGTVLRGEIGKQSAAATLGRRQDLAARVAAEVGELAAAWGTEVVGLELQIAASPAAESALENEAGRARTERAIQAVTTEPQPDRPGDELIALATGILANRPEDPVALATLAAGLARTGKSSDAAAAQRRAIEALRGMLTHQGVDERQAILEKAEALRERYESGGQ